GNERCPPRWRLQRDSARTAHLPPHSSTEHDDVAEVLATVRDRVRPLLFRQPAARPTTRAPWPIPPKRVPWPTSSLVVRNSATCSPPNSTVGVCSAIFGCRPSRFPYFLAH